MKRILLAATLIASFIFSTTAQSFIPGEWKFGIQAGIGLANLRGDIEDAKMKVGFDGGIVVDYALTEQFYLQSGLSFAMKGTKNEVEASIGNVSYKQTVTTNLNYLQLPVLAAYRINISDNIGWDIQAGPYIGVGIGGKVKVKAETNVSGIPDVEEKTDSFGDDRFKRFDFGLKFGTGINIDRIFVMAGYELGLLNIADSDDVSLRNGNLTFTVGFMF